MRARILAVAAALLAATSLALPALAADGGYAVATGAGGLDGLFFTTSGKTLTAGTVVVGGAFVYATGEGGSVTTAPVTLTAGFSDRLEAGVCVPLLVQLEPEAGGSESGVGDLDLRVKYSLQGETAELPAFAVYAHAKVATADSPLGTEHSDFGVGLAADKDFGGIQALLNVQYDLVDEGHGGNQLNWALGLRVPWSQASYFSAELLDQYFVTARTGLAGGIGGDILLGGVTIDLPPAMNLSFNLGLGLNEASPDALVSARFTFTL